MHEIMFALCATTVVALACAMPGCASEKPGALDTTPAESPVFDIKTVAIERQESGVEASLRGVSAVNENICSASGTDGTVLRTIDAGQTWQRLAMPGANAIDFRDVHAFDADQAIVMGISSPARFFKTEDAGATWREVYFNDAPGVFFDAMTFADDKHGYAFSDPIDGRLLIVRTEDGGDTWYPIDPRAIPPALSNEAGFAASGTCLATRGGDHLWIGLGGATGAEGARVLRSDDAGETWIPVTTPIKTGPSAGIFSIAFFDKQSGVAIGGDFQQPDQRIGLCAVTVDGGKSWIAVDEADTAPFGYRSVIACVPFSRVCLAAGPNGIDISDNGGRSWTRLNATGVHAMSFAPTLTATSAAVGWAVGADGRVARVECTLRVR